MDGPGIEPGGARCKARPSVHHAALSGPPDLDLTVAEEIAPFASRVEALLPAAVEQAKKGLLSQYDIERASKRFQEVAAGYAAGLPLPDGLLDGCIADIEEIVGVVGIG